MNLYIMTIGVSVMILISIVAISHASSYPNDLGYTREHQSRLQIQQQNTYISWIGTEEENKKQQNQLQHRQQRQRREQEAAEGNTYKSRPVFGTSAGYDVGGDEPMCWKTEISLIPNVSGGMGLTDDNTAGDKSDDTLIDGDDSFIGIDNSSDTNQSAWLDIDTLNDAMYAPATSEAFPTTRLLSSGKSTTYSSTNLLPECYSNFSIGVQPLEVMADRKILVGHDYTFQITLHGNLTLINEKLNYNTVYPNGSASIFARLILCNVMRQGFCNPMRDTRLAERMLERNNTDIFPNSTNAKTNNTSSTENSSSTLANPSSNSTHEVDQRNQSNKTRNKFQYQDGAVLLGIQEDSLIFTRWISLTASEVSKVSVTNSTYTSTMNITVRIPNGSKSGTYFFIGHGVLSFDFNTSTIFRIDVANAIPDQVLEVVYPPHILTVSATMKSILGASIGVFGFVTFVMFTFIIRHRNHIVMRITQGPFLAAITFACLVQIVFTVTVLPTHNVFCLLDEPMSLIPLTIIAAILVGRAWRVYSTVAKISTLGRSSLNELSQKNQHRQEVRQSIMEEGFVSFLGWLSHPNLKFMQCRKMGSVQSSIRQTITAKESLTLVSFLSIPQIVIQASVIAMYQPELEIVLNEPETVGRAICGRIGSWVEPVGLAYCTFVFILAVSMAWISRGLPSAFNEKNEIFKVAFVCAFFTSSQITFVSFINIPELNPDFVVLIKGSFRIGCSVMILWLMIWSKIKRVRSGEKIVIGNLLGARFGNVTDGPTKAPKYPINGSTKQQNQETCTNRATSTTMSEDDIAMSSNPNNSNNNSLQRVRLGNGEALPPSIERKMHRLQLLLQDLSNQICDGRPVTLDEFEALKEAVGSLQNNLLQVDMDGSTIVTPKTS